MRQPPLHQVEAEPAPVAERGQRAHGRPQKAGPAALNSGAAGWGEETTCSATDPRAAGEKCADAAGRNTAPARVAWPGLTAGWAATMAIGAGYPPAAGLGPSAGCGMYSAPSCQPVAQAPRPALRPRLAPAYPLRTSCAPAYFLPSTPSPARGLVTGDVRVMIGISAGFLRGEQLADMLGAARKFTLQVIDALLRRPRLPRDAVAARLGFAQASHRFIEGPLRVKNRLAQRGGSDLPQRGAGCCLVTGRLTVRRDRLLKPFRRFKSEAGRRYGMRSGKQASICFPPLILL